MPRTRYLAACAIATAVASCRDYDECPGTGDIGVERVPAQLSQTGLYADIASATLADDVVAFEPQFELWSDGAEKQRWIVLPSGARIGTENMNSWVFPEGTKLWKEFRRDGVRVETRLLHKLGPSDDDWVGVAYVWSADQRDASAAIFGLNDALGTHHDVPSAGECIACHGGRNSRVLGFSAIQLSAPASAAALDLDGLIATDRLSHPPAGPFIVPGDETERAALGYLHANCGHCHNQKRPASDGPRCFNPENEVDFQLSVADLGAPSDTATYRSAARCIEPGDSESSNLIDLVSQRGKGDQMPPLATERVDEAAVALLRKSMNRM